MKSLGSPPVLALTATATPEVTADIEKQLDLGKLRVIRTGIYRPNLHFEVKRVTNEREKHEELMQVLREHDGVGIIYCATVKTVEAEYFGEEMADEGCGTCDNCVHPLEEQIFAPLRLCVKPI